MRFLFALVCVFLVAISWVNAATVSCSDPNASTPADGCGSPCPDTCQNQGLLYQCLETCEDSCECNDGYLLDTESGYCVLEADCPE